MHYAQSIRSTRPTQNTQAQHQTGPGMQKYYLAYFMKSRAKRPGIPGNRCNHYLSGRLRRVHTRPAYTSGTDPSDPRRPKPRIFLQDMVVRSRAEAHGPLVQDKRPRRFGRTIASPSSAIQFYASIVTALPITLAYPIQGLPTHRIYTAV